MIDFIRELYGHQAWADAEHWRALERCPAALHDTKVIERLHHLHQVQRAFLWAVRDQSRAFTRTKPQDFPSPGALKQYAREFHDDVAGFLPTLSEGRLAESVTIPWFKDPPLLLAVGRALTQAAMHSHYHRGQNATRLRELGGEPPSTDLIVWYWKGAPAADWS